MKSTAAKNLIGIVSSLMISGFASQALAGATDNYVALGDSYAAGTGTSVRDLDWTCFQSSEAYASIIAEERPNTNTTFMACQGAVTEDVLNEQLVALDRKTNYVSLSIGGNDVGFVEMILNCGLYFDEWQCLTKADEIIGRITSELPAKLDATYAAIADKAPNAKVLQFGYPKMFSNDLSCWGARGISAAEAVKLNEVVEILDQVISERATAAGITYVSTIDAFAGHEVCSAQPYVNGKDGLYIEDIFHPTKDGHRYGHAPLLKAFME